MSRVSVDCSGLFEWMVLQNPPLRSLCVLANGLLCAARPPPPPPAAGRGCRGRVDSSPERGGGGRRGSPPYRSRVVRTQWRSRSSSVVELREPSRRVHVLGRQREVLYRDLGAGGEDH